MHQLPPRFQWSDPLLFEQQLSECERAVRDRTADFARLRLAPRINAWLRSARADPAIFREMGERGLLGMTLPAEYGGTGLGQVCAGLVAHEVERIDSGYRSMMTAQTSLVILPILRYGSVAQRQRYLPALARGALIGCFGFTETAPACGPLGMAVRARAVAGGYRLDGVKSAVINSPVAGLFLVWARDEAGAVRGFILDKAMAGLAAPVTAGTVGLRGSLSGNVAMDNVFCPNENVLAVQGIQAPLACLQAARYCIGWGALGAASTCWQSAHLHAFSKRRFGVLMADEPLVRNKLDEMQVGVAMALQGCLRLGRAIDAGVDCAEMVAMVTRHACATALDVARLARDLVVARAVGDCAVARHLVNLELVHAYVGKHQIPATGSADVRT